MISISLFRAAGAGAASTGRRPAHLFFTLLGLAGFGLAWQIGAVIGGAFVLPTPGETVARLADLIRDGSVWAPMLITTIHVGSGYATGCLVGICLGLLGGSLPGLGIALEAVATVILGIPPIVWIVMALLWFGPRGVVPAFTVAVGIAPIVFAGAVAGMRASSPELDLVAAAFKAPLRQRFWEIRLPQIMLVLTSTLATALALSWKIALMAEVLSGGEGLGGRIADARANLDIPVTFAWVAVALLLLLLTDRLLARLTSAPAVRI